MSPALTLRIVQVSRTPIIAALCLLGGGMAAQPAAVFSIPNPIVIGPIPATAAPGDPSHDYPFFSTYVDLASYGYVEEEYFLEGTANRYDMSQPLETASIIDGGHPYRTRMVVRRPISPDRFDGTVLMEWQNNATNHDLDAGWASSQEHFIRRGYAWVGVSAFRAGIHTPVVGLKAWNPARYGTLDVTDGGTILNDALSFDIFSQAAMAVKSPNGMVDPMGGLHVERIFGIGASQSSNNGLVSYHNSIHPQAGVFDAFLSVVGATGPFRTDLDVKVFRLWTETEAARAPFASRQPNSDHLRRWEVAGAAHYDWHMREMIRPLQARDLGTTGTPSCDFPPFSRIPLYYVSNAVFDWMVAWVKDGISPPTAPEIAIVSFGSPNVLARDSFGNAFGGIQLSQHAVPTATNTGLNGPATNFCRTYGSFMPFNQATLDALYPKHGTYVSQVARVTTENLMAGYLVWEDAETTVRGSAESNIGKR